MRNLVNFIANNHATFLFVMLELVGFGLLVSFNNYHNIKFLSETAEFSGSFYNSVNNFTEYVSLKETNVKLAEENAALKSMLRSSYMDESHAFLPIQDSTLNLNYQFTAAKVIQSTINKRNNYLILDKGAINGIRPQMGVIEDGNAVGIITEVSEHYATVMPLLHGQAKWSGQLKHQLFFGLVTWDGLDPTKAQLNDIPTHVDVSQGDSIVTRGGSGIFPEGMLIGTVQAMEEDPTTGFFVINIEPAANIQKTRFVHVVENLFAEEVRELESEAEGEE